ncbi:Hypothetical protein I5071_63620 [Sandaracinus amylolyticus]|nr:Hypothetical protein I5071_63620 [Sandaracinus amylolyticus]
MEHGTSLGTVDEARRARLEAADEWIGYREAAELLGYGVLVMKSGREVSLTRHGDHKTRHYAKAELLEYVRRRDEAGWMTLEAAEERLLDEPGFWKVSERVPASRRGGVLMRSRLEVEATYERHREMLEERAKLTPGEKRELLEAARREAREIARRMGFIVRPER